VEKKHIEKAWLHFPVDWQLTVVRLPGASENGTHLVRSGK
jgi:hypothetical protein